MGQGRHTHLAQMKSSIVMLINAANASQFNVIGNPTNPILVEFPNIHEAVKFAELFEKNFQITIGSMYIMNTPTILVFTYTG